MITYAQDYPFDIDTGPLLEKWKQAKARIIEKFGGKTRVRSALPIKVTLSEEQQDRKFKEFISELNDNAVLTVDFEDFLTNNKAGFFNNRVVVPDTTHNICQGAKLSRSFKHFVPRGDVRRTQDLAAEYIQQNKVEGYLYLSVDPIDFLTLSENNHSWSSCHSLDGEYRAGDLSYMMDNVTIIAYIANEHMEPLKCFPEDIECSDKKWRMLVHINEGHCIYYNKQYPYDSDVLLKETYNMIKEYFGTNYLAPYRYGFREFDGGDYFTMKPITNYLFAFGNIFDTREIIDCSDYNGYCDLISSPTYLPIVSLCHAAITTEVSEDREKNLEDFRNMFGIKIGAKVPCVCCGNGEVKRTDSFLCEECIAVNDADEDFFIKCIDCGHRIYEDDEMFEDEKGNIYCKSCYHAKQEEDRATQEEDL